MQGRFTSPDEFTGGPDELYYFVEDASENPTFYADLSNPQSLNKYQYSYNNPLRYVDPDGHEPENEQDPRPATGQALPIPVTPPAPGPIPIIPPGNPLKNPFEDYLVEPNSNAIPPQVTEGPTPVPLPDNRPDINKPIIPPDTRIRFGPDPDKPIVVSTPQAKKDGTPPGRTSAGRPTDKNGRPLGPSGKPMIHQVNPGGKKAAKDAARNAGEGAPIRHPSPRRGQPHYHPTNRSGKKIPNGTHFNYD